MITIVYGAYVALGQKNLKRLIAYSSVSHMGFVTLGLVSFNALGITGAMYQMVSHGLIASMLFLIAGILYDRTKDLEIDNYSGLASKMPYFTAFVVVAFFASLGLPGFSGFIGEIFVFLGVFDSSLNLSTIPVWMVGVSLLGLVLTAAYYLWTLQRMFFGKYWVKDQVQWNNLLTDLNPREMGVLIVLGCLVLLFGIFPSLLSDLINPSIDHLTRVLR
jgi:NADH-quinone oxidoreductase subunit M